MGEKVSFMSVTAKTSHFEIYNEEKVSLSKENPKLVLVILVLTCLK